MNNYYNKLVNRKKLNFFWTFSNNELKNTFQINYKFIFCFIKKNVFFDFNIFVSIVKKVFPTLHSIVDNKGKFVFIGTNMMYLQSTHLINGNQVGHIVQPLVGSFTNFSLCGFSLFDRFKLDKLPAVFFFFNMCKTDYFILEAKKRNIPIIALVNCSVNSVLVDYPIILNSHYFYNIYILSRFFFRYIVKLV